MSTLGVVLVATVARWPDCERSRSNCCSHSWSSLAISSEPSAMGGPDVLNVTNDGDLAASNKGSSGSESCPSGALRQVSVFEAK